MMIRKGRQVSISPRGAALLFWEVSDLADFESADVASGIAERLDAVLCTANPTIANESSRQLVEGALSRMEVTTQLVAEFLWGA